MFVTGLKLFRFFGTSGVSVDYDGWWSSNNNNYYYYYDAYGYVVDDDVLLGTPLRRL